MHARIDIDYLEGPTGRNMDLKGDSGRSLGKKKREREREELKRKLLLS